MSVTKGEAFERSLSSLWEVTGRKVSKKPMVFLTFLPYRILINMSGPEGTFIDIPVLWAGTRVTANPSTRSGRSDLNPRPPDYFLTDKSQALYQAKLPAHWSADKLFVCSLSTLGFLLRKAPWPGHPSDPMTIILEICFEPGSMPFSKLPRRVSFDETFRKSFRQGIMLGRTTLPGQHFDNLFYHNIAYSIHQFKLKRYI